MSSGVAGSDTVSSIDFMEVEELTAVDDPEGVGEGLATWLADWPRYGAATDFQTFIAICIAAPLAFGFPVDGSVVA